MLSFITHPLASITCSDVKTIYQHGNCCGTTTTPDTPVIVDSVCAAPNGRDRFGIPLLPLTHELQSQITEAHNGIRYLMNDLIEHSNIHFYTRENYHKVSEKFFFNVVVVA